MKQSPRRLNFVANPSLKLQTNQNKKFKIFQFFPKCSLALDEWLDVLVEGLVLAVGEANNEVDEVVGHVLGRKLGFFVNFVIFLTLVKIESFLYSSWLRRNSLSLLAVVLTSPDARARKNLKVVLA